MSGRVNARLRELGYCVAQADHTLGELCLGTSKRFSAVHCWSDTDNGWK